MRKVDKVDLVMLMFVGIIAGVVLNVGNLLDVYREFSGAQAHFVAQYVCMAISSSFLSAALVTWAIMRFKHRRAIELWEKFQIPE